MLAVNQHTVRVGNDEMPMIGVCSFCSGFRDIYAIISALKCSKGSYNWSKEFDVLTYGIGNIHMYVTTLSWAHGKVKMAKWVPLWRKRWKQVIATSIALGFMVMKRKSAKLWKTYVGVSYVAMYERWLDEICLLWLSYLIYAWYCAQIWKEGNIKREDVWITSKLWNDFHKMDEVEKACRDSLKRLRLDYLDLYLIHWPVTGNKGESLIPPIKVCECKLQSLLLTCLYKHRCP